MQFGKRWRLPAALLAVSIFFFLFAWAKTSPYRLLRPYHPFWAKNLASTKTRHLKNRESLQIAIPSDSITEGFWIDQIPVTIDEYARCVRDGMCNPPHYRGYFAELIRSPYEKRFPITYVSWQEAQTFCAWQGGTLPTNAQWKRAAGGDDGRTYPWGNQEPTMARANFDGYYQGLIPAGWLPKGASAYGVLDMAGNVREWVMDAYVEHSKTTDQDQARMLKGGSSSDYPNTLEINAFQFHNENSPGYNRGFRCVYPGEF